MHSQVFCDMETDGGGYTYYPVKNGIATGGSGDWDSCQVRAAWCLAMLALRAHSLVVR
jgi:hypothetical protein